ncbi:MAG: hypothetical protein IT479_05595 [Xanthomonadales bacterium]|nr:hypothetical protein [Xanthomonadales bacterium]MCC6592731.1 hypothetical protein [Xanthomonadales bacterium]MCE7932565.1 hypothetical protein [Xanthomonadales bacterium PRO6]
MRHILAACLLLASASLPAAAYELEWRLALDPKTKSAQGSLTLGKGAGEIRSINFNFAGAYSEIRADGELLRRGPRALWTPPARGGTIRWRVAIEQRRENGAYRSYFPGDWAIFRGDRVFPSAGVRAAKGAESRARLVLDLPKGWHYDTAYLLRADGSFDVDDPDRRFDRPVGWMLVGDIGTRREVIAGTEVALGAPKDEGMRRMDMLAFLNYTLPAMKDAFGTLPPKIFIVQAPDPMWRGGLSGPRSLYLHLDRPMVSENATSTLLHELTHVVTRIRGQRDEDDWLAEGLAEFYAVELLFRTGGMTAARHQKTLAWLADWGKGVKSLRGPRSSAQTTARAALLLRAVDEEIQRATDDRRNLDDLTRRLMRERKVSTAEFIEAAEKVAGRKLKSLDTPLLRAP